MKIFVVNPVALRQTVFWLGAFFLRFLSVFLERFVLGLIVLDEFLMWKFERHW